jgi:hypothetical protein
MGRRLQMRGLSIGLMNRTIALLMITGACALPLYSQEETRQQTQSARSVSDKISEDFRKGVTGFGLNLIREFLVDW